MTQRPLRVERPVADQAALRTQDVLRAVATALQGDRQKANARVATAGARYEQRVNRVLGTLGASEPTAQGSQTRPVSPPRPESPPPMAPLQSVQLKLPDGTRAWIALEPAAARHRDLLAVAQVGDTNAKRAFDVLAEHSRAIGRLGASQRELAEQLAKMQSTGDLALLRGLVEGLAKLERRFEAGQRSQSNALGAHRRAVHKQVAQQQHMLAAQTRAAQIQKVQGAVASAQSAAFGERGELLARENVTLALNQIGWGFLSEILETIGLAKPGAMGPLVWLAPLGSLLTSQAILGDPRQRE